MFGRLLQIFNYILTWKPANQNFNFLPIPSTPNIKLNSKATCSEAPHTTSRHPVLSISNPTAEAGKNGYLFRYEVNRILEFTLLHRFFLKMVKLALQRPSSLEIELNEWECQKSSYLSTARRAYNQLCIAHGTQPQCKEEPDSAEGEREFSRGSERCAMIGGQQLRYMQYTKHPQRTDSSGNEMKT